MRGLVGGAGRGGAGPGGGGRTGTGLHSARRCPAGRTAPPRPPDGILPRVLPRRGPGSSSTRLGVGLLVPRRRRPAPRPGRCPHGGHPGAAAVVPAAVRGLPRREHHQHDHVVPRRPGLLRPPAPPPARPPVSARRLPPPAPPARGGVRPRLGPALRSPLRAAASRPRPAPAHQRGWGGPGGFAGGTPPPRPSGLLSEQRRGTEGAGPTQSGKPEPPALSGRRTPG